MQWVSICSRPPLYNPLSSGLARPQGEWITWRVFEHRRFATSARIAMVRDSVRKVMTIQGTPTVIINGWRFRVPPSIEDLRRLAGELQAGRDPFVAGAAASDVIHAHRPRMSAPHRFPEVLASRGGKDNLEVPHLIELDLFATTFRRE